MTPLADVQSKYTVFDEYVKEKMKKEYEVSGYLCCFHEYVDRSLHGHRLDDCVTFTSLVERTTVELLCCVCET